MTEKRYRVGEVAKLLNLNTSVLRYWEKEFPQLEPPRTEKGQRFYTERDVALLRRIHQLTHEQGMTIMGARRILEGSAVVDDNLPEKIVAVPDPVFMDTLKRELLSIRRLLVEE